MKKIWYTFFCILNFSLFFLTFILKSEYPKLFPYLLILNISLAVLLFLFQKNTIIHFAKVAWKAGLLLRFTNVFLFISIFALLNYWGFKFPKQWDFTRNQVHTLTLQTKQILKSMPHDLKFVSASTADGREAQKAMAELYRFEKNNVIIDDVDIARRPDIVDQYQITDSSAFIIYYEGRVQVVRELTELAIANALIRLSRPEELSIGVVIGHKELDFFAEDKDGLSSVRKQLELLGYNIVPLPLLENSSIPENIKSLIIWGPKSGLQKHELNLLENYYQKGGNILLALDPDAKGDPASDFRNWFYKKGIVISNNLVVDSQNSVNGSRGTIPLIKNFSKESEIVKNFEGQVFFPYVSMVSKNNNWDTNEGADFKALLETSTYPQSFAEINIDEIKSGEFKFNGGDIPGPIVVGAVFEKNYKDRSQRIVAFGNSSFPLNAFKNMTDNTKLFLNSVSYISGEYRLMSFDIPTLNDPVIILSSSQLNIAFYFSVVFVPLCLVALSIAVFRYRST